MSIYDGFEIFASSGSAVDVQTASDTVSANGGGIVYIPAGYWEWSQTDQVTVYSGGVSFVGATPLGIDGYPSCNKISANPSTATIIHAPAGGGSFFSIGHQTHAQTTNEPSMIANIQFEADPPASASYEMNGRSGVSFRQIPNWRVTHCNFVNMAGTAVFADANDGWVYTDVSCYGVADHNWVSNPYKETGASWVWGYGFYPRGTWYDESSWISDITQFAGYYGHRKGASIMFIEDNLFEQTRHATDGIAGGWCTVRRNKFDKQYNEYQCGVIDNHGSRDWVGGKGFDAYENTIILPEFAPWEQALGNYYHGLAFELRGGTALIHSNTVIKEGAYDAYTYMVQLYEEGSIFAPDKPYSWIEKAWIWDNTKTPSLNFLDNPHGLIENIDYFLRAPDPILGEFSYQPYVYPHPLVTDTPFPEPTPTASPTSSPSVSPSPTPTMNPDGSTPVPMPTPAPTPFVQPTPPPETGDWLTDVWNGFWYWLRWGMFGWLR